MNETLILEHPGLHCLLAALKVKGLRSVVEAIGSDDVYIDLINPTKIKFRLRDVNALVERMLLMGFTYIDKPYLRRGYLHARLNHKFNLWADSRDTLLIPSDMEIDFSGELKVSIEMLSSQDQIRLLASECGGIFAQAHDALLIAADEVTHHMPLRAQHHPENLLTLARRELDGMDIPR